MMNAIATFGLIVLIVGILVVFESLARRKERQSREHVAR